MSAQNTPIISNKFWIKGEVTDQQVNDLITKILDCPAKRIILFINSHGGDYDCAKYLHSFLTEVDKYVVTAVVGDCSSSAMLIVLAGKERWATSLSKFMIHPGSNIVGDALIAKFNPVEENGAESSLFMTPGDFQEVIDLCQKEIAQFNKDNQEYYKLISDHSNLTVKKIKERVETAKDNDWYFTAKEAMKMQIIDNIGLPSQEDGVSGGQPTR